MEKIELKKLTMDELLGVVNLYPWFGSAKKELCERIGGLGEENVSLEQFSDAAMYIPSRAIIFEIYRTLKKVDYSDINIAELLRTYIAPREKEGSPKYVPGGDFFSRAEYDKMKVSEDLALPKFSFSITGEDTVKNENDLADLGFYTETLAQIYVDQGYYDRAITIYSKLILAYPEKNVYFASLIENLKKI